MPLGIGFELLHEFRKTTAVLLFGTSAIFMFSIAITPGTEFIFIAVFQILCYSYAKIVPHWLSTLLILISNDIELNPVRPGYHSNSFNFMSWNLNSLATNNFERVRLLEADNTIFNYDLIAICETSLNDSQVPKVPELNGYTFESANHPSNLIHGGVGIFYKNSLPVVLRRDLSFDESLS